MFFITLLLSTNNFPPAISSSEDNIFPIFYKASTTNITVNSSRIEKDLEFITGQGAEVWSRVSGYPGFWKTADYLAEQFRSCGMEVVKEYVEVTVPIDLGSSILVLSQNGEVLRNITAYVLSPNNVNPSPYLSPSQGDRLIEGESGDFSEFNGKDIDGSFVLMDFNCRWLWKNAAYLGAKGIIFWSKEPTTRIESDSKSFGVPVSFPRLYVLENDGLYLQKLIRNDTQFRIQVKCNMNWVKIKVPNIVAYLEGTDSKLKNEFVVIMTHYDSWSVIPSISPGATEGCSVASLLELARLFSANRPQRTLMFVALAGYWQGLTGAREFVYSHFADLGLKIKAIVGLDLSSEGKTLGVYNVGNTYSYMYNIQQSYYSLSYRIFNQYIPSIESATGKKYDVINLLVKRETLAFPPYEAIPVMLDIEPFVCACYGGAFALRTMNIIRLRLGSPSDSLELVYSSKSQKENLLTQVEFIHLLLEKYVRDSDLALSFFPQVFTSDQGYATLEIRITSYNISTAWYDPFPNSDDVIVYVSMIMAYSMQTGTLVTATTTTAVKNIELFLKPDSNGIVTIHGLKPYSSGLVRAYVINKTSGTIEYSYDVGTYGAPASPATLVDKRMFLMMNRNTVKYISMFRAGSIVLYYMVDPKTFSIPTAAGISTSGLVSPTIQVYNFFAHGWVINYAVESMWPELMVFAQTGIPIEIVLTTGGKAVIALLLNNSESMPYGRGYTLKPGEMIILKNTPGTIAKSMFLLADDRVGILESRYTFNPLTRLYHSYAREYNRKLIESSVKKDYSSVYADSFSMWSFSLQSYGVTMGFMWEVLVTAVVFFLAVIPFAFIMRSLISEAGGFKGLLLMATIFLSCAAFLHVFHPAFSIATNIYIVLLSFLISLVIGILLFFVSEELSMTTSIIRRRISGAYFEGVSKFDFLVNSMGIGLKNMRARKLRTALTLTSITIVVFSLMVFSSVTTARMLIATDIKKPLPEGYEGLYIRGAAGWEDVIPEELYYYLKNKYHENAIVTARAWFYFPIGSQGPRFKFFTGGSAFATCLLGLMPEEKYITNIDQELIPGSRWFEHTDLYTCIINEELAKSLSEDTGAPFGVGNEIEIWGIKLKVIGILKSSFVGTDLDGKQITPASKEPQAASIRGFEVPQYSWKWIVIVPYNFIAKVLMLRPEIHTISVRFTDAYGSTKGSAEELALSSSLDVFFASDSKAYVIRPRDMPSAVGVNLTLPMILIAMSIILNMILGSLYERTKEIGIYSSIGFSPTHISGSFFVEMISYSLASGILGYVLGVGVSYWLWSINWYPPELYSNFSSVNMLLILALNFLVTMSATVYPALKASRIVTPSLQRKWSMPTPKGNEWRIPLPFASGSLEETFGMMMFLKRWFDIHSVRDAGNFLSVGNNLVVHEADGRRKIELVAEVRLPPYDAGINQYTHIFAVETKGQTYEFEVYIVRISGMENLWKTSNRNFIDELRKRLLVWRSLSAEEKAQYINMFREYSDIKSGERNNE